MVVEESYEYAPPGGTDATILIHGIAPYVPGKRRVIGYFTFIVPADATHRLPDRCVATSWADVEAKIFEHFPAETAEGLKGRMTAISPLGSMLP